MKLEEESEGERRSSKRVLARMEEMGANASGEVDSVNLYLNYTYTHHTFIHSWCSLAGGAAGLPGVARTALAARTRRNAKIQSGSSLPRGHIQPDI